MSVPYEKVVEEDLNLGAGTVQVTMPGGGSATGHKIGPHSFSARAVAAELGATQAVSASTDTLELDTEELDTDDWFDPVTFTFQPDVAGVYLVTAQATIETLTGEVRLALYRGASEIAAHDAQRTAADATVQVSALVTMDGSADTLTLRLSHTHGSSRNVTAANLSAVLLNKLDV